MSIRAVARSPRVVFLLACAAILVAPTVTLAAPASAAGSAATASVLAPVGRVIPTALGPGVPSTNRAAFAQPFRTLDPGALRAAKLRAAALASRGSRGPSVATGTSVAGFFNNLNSPGLSDYSVAPPDSTGAIGPNNYIEMVNQKIGVYDRSLNLLSSTDNGTFTGAGSGLSVSDPQIQWDGHSDRWLYAAIGVATGANMLILGWSKTRDPSDLTNGWCRFGIPRGNLLDDYPKLGHDDNYLSIGTNVYDDSTNFTFITANVFALPTPVAGDASCTVGIATYFADATSVLHNADRSVAFTPVPANTADASAFGYIVAAHSPVDGTGTSEPMIMVWHLASVGGSPALVADGDVLVSTFGIPAPVPQPGTSDTLDSLDARLTQAVAVNDPLAGNAKGIWTQHTVAGGGGSVVRWYEILAVAPAPKLRQQGEVASTTDFVFNGAVSPSIGGDSAAVFYNRGGASTLPVIGAQTRSAATPLNSLDSGELPIGQSTAADVDFTCGYSSPTAPCRWGDYAGASPDPLNAGVVWGSSQVTGGCFILCGFFTQWQTRNFAVVASTVTAPPVLTTITVTPASASVPTGGTQQFSATGLDQFGNALSPQPTFSWSVGGGGTINTAGLFSATTPGGPFTVTAASGGVSGTASVTVTAPPVLTTITVTPASASVQTGGTQQFSATGLDQFGNALSPQPTFTWSVGGGGTINTAGLFSATTPGGPFTVTAAGGGLSGTASVTVTDFSLSLSPTSRSVKHGQSTSYSITITRLFGFTGSVAFTVIGLPANGTASFTPASTTGTSATLSVSTSGKSPRGTYSLTITGTSGGLTRSTTVSLTLT